MLEIRRGIAARNYENTFFREFAENLKLFFDKYSLDGLLIANSECEVSPNLQIDVLLLTNNVVCLIDLKNIGGTLVLPKNDNDFRDGQWITKEGVLIKGGSHINPYKQLVQQKRAFGWVYHNSLLKDEIGYVQDAFNSSHAKKIVCFQKPIDVIGNIPGKDVIDFSITDVNGYLETIKDILDVKDASIDLSVHSFDLFKEIFRANKFELKESYTETVSFDSYSKELDFETLSDDQAAALKEVAKFIKSETEDIFILQGTSLSGKSHLIPYIEDIAYKNNIKQVEMFASSSRVATNLLSESKLEFKSMYAYIYGGGLQSVDTENNEIPQEENNSEKLKLEIVPLKKSDDEDEALFIIDEAQLVSDNYHQSIDLRFGSGKLLEDFIAFSDLKNTKRKIILIGDSFKLSIGKKEESPLNPDYFKEHYQLETKAFQLLDKRGKSEIVDRSLITIDAIRNNRFNKLSFDLVNTFNTIEKNEISNIINSKIRSNSDFHLLGYTNLDAQKVNLWIKNSIIKNGEDIATDDFVIFNNNFKIEDSNDPFAQPQKVFNGQFGVVESVDINSIEEVISPKGKQAITLKFRNINIKLKDTGNVASVLSFENYRLNDKGELSEEELLALKIILNREIKAEFEKYPFEKSDIYKELLYSYDYKNISNEISLLQSQLNNGEKVKTKLEDAERKQRKLVTKARKKYRKQSEKKLNKDTSTKYYQYKNAAHIKFGWALTVHKSSSFKWDEIILNTDQGSNRGKTNEEYFKWIYTALTRAKSKVSLINYEVINPMFKIDFKDSTSQVKTDKKVYFIANTEIELSDHDKTVMLNFYFPEDKAFLLQLFQLFESQLKNNMIDISSVLHHNYQEVYELKGSNGESANIGIYYNNKGQFKKPSIVKSEPAEFGNEILEILTKNNKIENFNFIKEVWRKEIYSQLGNLLNEKEIGINFIIQSPYKDTMKLSKENADLTVDLFYNGDGFYSTISAAYYSNEELWEDFKSTIEIIKR